MDRAAVALVHDAGGLRSRGRVSSFRPLGPLPVAKVLHEDAASWVRERRSKRHKANHAS